MARLDLKLDGRVAVVTMGEDDNKLNLDMCNSLLEMLDKIERETEAVTLVVTSGHEKIWSNGFDIDWVEARLAEGEKEPVMQFLQRDLELRRRLLAYPLITIAALNGHVFGGGAVLSLCFDFRFMRSDRGFFCIPVVDRGYPIFQGTSALLGSVLPMYMVEDVILTSRRFTGVECAANHVVAETYDNAELMSKTMTFAGGLNKSRQIVGEMKKVLNGPVLRLIEEDMDHITQGEIRV
jgi:enoyl-CoA hydratase/carnithine racemase